MEKQPIDDLFARKLREAELPPSSDVFNRLQSRMVSIQLPTAKRRVAIWWYGVAASLLLIALFYFRGGSAVKQTALDQVARQAKDSSPVSPMPKQPPTQQVAKAGEEGTHRTVPVSAIQNGPDARQEKIMAVITKPFVGMKEAKSMATTGKEPVQKTVEQLPEITAITPEDETMAVITTPPVPGQTTQPKLPVAHNPAGQQRVVVMTIAEPKADLPIVALQPAKAESTSQAQPGSLAGLFAKVKQLKNGDALARATPAKRPADSRSRLGRVFEGMKESLKNETTLE